MTRAAKVLGLSALPLLLLALFAAVPDGSQPELAAREDLGRMLFWDPLLSGPRDVSCATCHHPDHAWADARDLPLGTGSVGLGPQRTNMSNGAIPPVKRNAPTILNVALNGANGRGRGGRGRGLQTPTAALASVDPARAPMFWDSRVRSLETQALEPLKAFDEMRGETYPTEVAVDSVVARLNAIPEYARLFNEAFGEATPAVTPVRLGQAIASFERTLLAVNSPFDRFRAGDSTALNAQQRRGQQAFNRAGCDNCHRGVMFSDFNEHAEGIKENPLVAEPDTGGSRFRFRTPSLRNVELTAPYMHNGVLATLEDVLRFYDAGRSENPQVVNARGRGRNGQGQALPPGTARLDGQFVGVRDMSDREMEDIIAFLKTLTDTQFEKTVPSWVPSGLPPGGRILATR
jgi:cytochrome c peroxidase